MSRTIREDYRKSRVFDVTCRNHGGCSWCEQGRRHVSLKRAGFGSHKRIRPNIIDPNDYEDYYVETTDSDRDEYS